MNIRALGLSLIIVVGIALGLSYLQDPENPPIIKKAHQVTCDVTIHNPFMKNVEIERYSCRVEQQCFFSLLFFEDKGNIELVVGNRKAYNSYNVGEFQRQTRTLSLCVPDGTHPAEIRLIGEDGTLITKKSFNLEVG